MLRFPADENFNRDIVRGLRLRRPAMELVRVQDVGLRQRDDRTVLAWAGDHDRILLTHDRATIPAFAFERVAAGQPMPGVFVLGSRRSVRSAIDEPMFIHDCSDDSEWRDRVTYLPM